LSIWFRILVLPWLWLISILPFPMLYGFSNFLSFLVYRVIGYRKAIVRQNLKNSFPEKTEAQLLAIEKKFYLHLTDLILETIKGMTITAKSLQKRMRIANPEIFSQLNSDKRSSIVVMSHCGNWEWVCDAAQISVSQYAQCVYKTLHNKSWDAWFLMVRSRFGTDPFPMEKTLRIMAGQKDQVTTTAFIGDQNPSSGKNAYWTSFLNQETCFMMGSEKIAVKLNQTVLYLAIHKVKRGYYECHTELLCANPGTTKEGEITEMIASATERDICRQPENWLWSHRRWKHKKPE